MSKYTYKTRTDLTEDQKTYIAQSSDLTIKTWIANELAEMNRLTRIEIRLTLQVQAAVNNAHYTEESNRKIDESLTDQA